MSLTLNQDLAVEKFKKLKVGALFMQQGTGKTRVALELINSSDADFVLFVCPHSTKANLSAEIEKWNVLRTPFEILAYETLSHSDKSYLEIRDTLRRYSHSFIVADESLFIKNDMSKRYARMLELAKLSDYRIILNGTPVTKNEWDIYNQMQFLSPKILNMSREEFQTTFMTEYKRHQGNKVRTWYKMSEVNIDYLHALIQPYVFQCDFDFGYAERAHPIVLPSSPETERKYGVVKNELINRLSEGDNILHLFTNLAKIVFTDESRYAYIAERLEREGQIIVFCFYLKEVHGIAKALNYNCHIITGETPQNERIERLNEFKLGTAPLLITYGVGSVGLNLQFCNKLAFASSTFDYAKIDQAKCRIRRLGQTRDIEYINFTSELGISRLIDENIRRKRSLHKMMIDQLEGREHIETIL